MCNSYIRFSVNGVRIRSEGSGITHSTEKFNSYKDIITKKSVIPFNLGVFINPGDIIKVELIKRNKTKPRIPRKTLIIEIDQNSHPDKYI